MFQMDEVAVQVPQESGADVWQNGRTGEMANFAVFKVHHTRDGFGRVRYQMEREGDAVAQHPFTGQTETYRFVLTPPMGSRPKRHEEDYEVPVFCDKPQYAFWENWAIILSLFGGILFWVAVIWGFWRLVCR